MLEFLQLKFFQEFLLILEILKYNLMNQMLNYKFVHFSFKNSGSEYLKLIKSPFILLYSNDYSRYIHKPY